MKQIDNFVYGFYKHENTEETGKLEKCTFCWEEYSNNVFGVYVNNIKDFSFHRSNFMCENCKDKFEKGVLHKCFVFSCHELVFGKACPTHQALDVGNEAEKTLNRIFQIAEERENIYLESLRNLRGTIDELTELNRGSAEAIRNVWAEKMPKVCSDCHQDTRGSRYFVVETERYQREHKRPNWTGESYFCSSCWKRKNQDFKNSRWVVIKIRGIEKKVDLATDYYWNEEKDKWLTTSSFVDNPKSDSEGLSAKVCSFPSADNKEKTTDIEIRTELNNLKLENQDLRGKLDKLELLVQHLLNREEPQEAKIEVVSPPYKN